MEPPSTEQIKQNELLPFSPGMKSKPIPPKEIYMRRPRGRIPAEVKAWLEVNEHWTGWEIAVCNCGKWYDQMDPLAPYYTETNWCKKCGYKSPPNKPTTLMKTMKTEDLADIADIDLEADDQYLDEQCRMIELLTGSKALAKACVDDPFDYAMKLRTGEVIAFSGAQVLNREWVHLRLKPMDQQPKENQIAYPADRGVDVRLSDIVWVMDAPLGS